MGGAESEQFVVAPEQLTPDALNAVDDRIFPPGARRGRSCGLLKLQGVPVTELVSRFGSPLYVLDGDAVRARAREVREALCAAAAAIGTTATVYYAGKALMAGAVVQWVTAEGLAVDVATGGELAVALAAGADPARIGFHGNNKSSEELEQAVAAGVGTIIIDGQQEIARVAEVAERHGVRQGVRLRVNSGVHASTHSYLATSHEDQKFGVPASEAVQLVSEITSYPQLDLRGLHCHIGSQIFGASGFRESARRMLAIYGQIERACGITLPELNLGGGFGIAYTKQDVSELLPIEEIARGICEGVAEGAREAGVAVPQLAFEPGRTIVGQAGVTLYTVGATKTVQLLEPEGPFTERLYVSVDGGMSDNARPALYGADYHVRLASRRSEAPAALVRVVGKHCESGDIVVFRALLPADVAAGDVLAVAATGAYCYSLSSNYNCVPRPPMVALEGGEARVIVRGETIDELVERCVL